MNTFVSGLISMSEQTDRQYAGGTSAPSRTCTTPLIAGWSER